MNDFSDMKLLEALQEQMGEDLAPADLALLPRVYRLVLIHREQIGERRTRCTATIFHEKAALRVGWVAGAPDLRLKPGDLVSPRWLGAASCENGAIKIGRLVLLERPEPWLNLFHTVPHGWVEDRELVNEAATLVEALPRPYRYLFNAIFWNGGRFRRFCTLQSSAYGHHSEETGSLRHAVETARAMRDRCGTNEKASAALCILAGLLHDAGKADEYRLSPTGEPVPTCRGKLVWHRVTVVEWIAEANSKWNLMLPESHYLALVHCLISSTGAPWWLGIRKPAMPEARFLAEMEKPSGMEELTRLTAPKGKEWGSTHPSPNGKQDQNGDMPAL